MTVSAPIDAMKRPLRTWEEACADSSDPYHQAMGRLSKREPVYMFIRAPELRWWKETQIFYEFTDYEAYARGVMEHEGFEAVEFCLGDSDEWERIEA